MSHPSARTVLLYARREFGPNAGFAAMVREVCAEKGVPINSLLEAELVRLELPPVPSVKRSCPSAGSQFDCACDGFH